MIAVAAWIAGILAVSFVLAVFVGKCIAAGSRRQ